jgi:hypothetical protein
VITGMPLKFYYSDWAQDDLPPLGGAQVARTLHHFAAVITFVYFTCTSASSSAIGSGTSARPARSRDAAIKLQPLCRRGLRPRTR